MKKELKSERYLGWLWSWGKLKLTVQVIGSNQTMQVSYLGKHAGWLWGEKARPETVQ